ncbi:uncharacterized protein LOC119728858 [Patiria miniata]|uniref:Uncharacterized protein n=1 Tax=Patiria miniata TaxID=46514 RepID=A0A914A0S8_PATMI|nr:uncharacterized protein LOC119728858 [Patiria miniata]
MKLSDFDKCKKGEEGIMMEGLSGWEKELCKIVWRMEIVGKRGRTVPVLLTEDLKQSMDLLKCKREQAGVMNGNKFMFPVQSSLGHIRGSDVLRKHAGLCGASKPEYLRSTRLRKHIGTVAQVMNLRDHEQDILANFMGHDIRVHREFYRLPEQTLQVAKVSKVLLQMEKGNLSSLAGSSLDEIRVEEEEEAPMDEPLHEDVDHEDEVHVGSKKKGSSGQKKNSHHQGEEPTGGDEDVDHDDERHVGSKKKGSSGQKKNSHHQGEEPTGGDEDVDHDDERHVGSKKKGSSGQKKNSHHQGEEPTGGGKASKKASSMSSKHNAHNEEGKRRTRKITKTPWSNDEKMAVVKNFGHCFQTCKLPGKQEIVSVLSSERVLQERTWTNIKDFVRNRLGKKDPLDFI